MDTLLFYVIGGVTFLFSLAVRQKLKATYARELVASSGRVSAQSMAIRASVAWRTRRSRKATDGGGGNVSPGARGRSTIPCRTGAKTARPPRMTGPRTHSTSSPTVIPKKEAELAM